jgi:hypothetical protein
MFYFSGTGMDLAGAERLLNEENKVRAQDTSQHTYNYCHSVTNSLCPTQIGEYNVQYDDTKGDLSSTASRILRSKKVHALSYNVKKKEK